MRISRRTLLRAGASTGLLAALAACGNDGLRTSAARGGGATTTTPTDVAQTASPTGVGRLPAAVSRTKFAMVGDSITKASSKSLTSLLDQQGFTEITIEAEVSRRIAIGDGKGEPLSGVRTLYTMIAEGIDPDIWAIAMGTNDVGKYDDADAYASLIDEMLAMPDAKVPIVWVDVYNPVQLAGTKVFNLVLRERASARGNTTVLPWFDLASDPQRKILRTDKIHPNEKGTLVFADLVSAALT